MNGKIVRELEIVNVILNLSKILSVRINATPGKHPISDIFQGHTSL